MKADVNIQGKVSVISWRETIQVQGALVLLFSAVTWN